MQQIKPTDEVEDVKAALSAILDWAEQKSGDNHLPALLRRCLVLLEKFSCHEAGRLN